MPRSNRVLTCNLTRLEPMGSNSTNLAVIKSPLKGAGLLLAERVGWSLRDRACGYAAAPVEKGSNPEPRSAKNKMAPRGGRVKTRGHLI